jgi:hypothetical protein
MDLSPLPPLTRDQIADHLEFLDEGLKTGSAA